MISKCDTKTVILCDTFSAILSNSFDDGTSTFRPLIICVRNSRATTAHLNVLLSVATQSSQINETQFMESFINAILCSLHLDCSRYRTARCPNSEANTKQFCTSSWQSRPLIFTRILLTLSMISADKL